MESLIQDFRYALRQLTKSPGFTLVAIVTLALGIGATTAVYSLANWILFRPLPGISDNGRLVGVSFNNGRVYTPTSFLDYKDFAARTKALSGLAGLTHSRTVAMAPAGLPARRVPADAVTANYFEVLGVQRYLGRYLDSTDLLRGAEPVAVISYRLWADVFDEDRRVVGQTVMLDRVATTIVGVAPPEFTGTDRVTAVDLWRPVTVKSATLMAGLDTYPYYFESRRFGVINEMVGRLAPGASAEQAEAQLRTAIARVLEEFPSQAYGLRGINPEIHRGLSAPLGSRNAATGTLRVLWWAAAILVLIAVANVANMLLFRTVNRRRELAVQRALGASTVRLARQSVVEGLVIAVAAGLSAVGLAAWLVMLFRGLRLPGMLPIGDVHVDRNVLAFGVALGVVTGIFVGLVPAFAGAGRGRGPSLQEASSRSGRRGYARGAIAVLQLSACLTLLVGALLLTGTVRSLRAVDVGFETGKLSVFSLDAPAAGYSEAQGAALRLEGLSRIQAIQGVEGAAQAFTTPFSNRGGIWYVYRDETGPEEKHAVHQVPVSSNYFSVMGIPMIGGRPFADVRSDGPSEREAVLTESTARWLFGSTDAVGRTFHTPGAPSPVAIMKGGPLEWTDPQWRVVGVVRDSRWAGVASDIAPMIYTPLSSERTMGFGVTFVVRSSVPFSSLKRPVEAALGELAPLVPVASSSMQDNVDASISEQRLFANVVSLLTLLAIVLAGVGLYSLVAFSVTQRTREFGIRIALGARVQEILDLVVWQGAALAGIGVVLGLGGAVALSRVLSHRLFGVTPLEPHVYLLAIALLVLLTLVASIVPARAATKVDPMVALRSE